MKSQRVTSDNVRTHLRGAGLRQLDLADHLGITQAAVSQKLTGRRPFTVAELEATAKLLKVHPGELFGEVPA